MQDNLTTSELHFLEQFPLETHKVTNYVGSGAEHIVRRYKTGDVIKYLRWKVGASFLKKPIANTVNRAKEYLLDRGAAEMRESRDICHEFLPEGVCADLEVISSTDESNYVLLQPFEQQEELTTAHIRDNKNVRETTKAIIDAARKIYDKEGLILDLSGFSAHGLLLRRLQNIAIHNGQPKVYDQTCYGRNKNRAWLKQIHFAIVEKYQRYMAFVNEARCSRNS
jgi:hypothetical protein